MIAANQSSDKHQKVYQILEKNRPDSCTRNIWETLVQDDSTEISKDIDSKKE